MTLDPMTRLSRECGCNACGTKGDAFYWLEYYVLPSRLVRKRHREKETAAIYCRACFEQKVQFQVLVDGRPYSVEKMGPHAARSRCAWPAGSHVTSTAVSTA